MNKFILNRPDDSKSLSRRKIIVTTFKWLILLMAIAIVLRVICVVIYRLQGLNPMEMTKFIGDPTNYLDNASWTIIAKLMIVAPVMEEVMFRLGLSFKRATVALWVGLLPLVCVYYMHHCRVWYILLVVAGIGAILSWLVYHFTTDEQWKVWRKKYVIPAMWISAIGFGLIHLRAFSVLNLQVFPFAIATILVPMAGGCAITYARVNLGFWWGVLFHCIINIPPVLVIASAM
ncbi:MAG: CPBP family intramembrane metalloprotease [Prevotella sp.]|nr:CPBP family intramembrane metalloprotease [Prevotella sp.]